MSPLALLLGFLVHSKTVSSYWISENRLSWNRSLNYCRSICDSDLASFRDESDYQQALDLISNSSYLKITNGMGAYAWQRYHDIWIGLNDITQEGHFQWSDNSSFHFGNDTSGAVYPWAHSASNEPNNGGSVDETENCVGLWQRGDFVVGWNDYNCEGMRRFMCNSCEGVLDKYILYHLDDEKRAWNESQDKCMEYLDTSLASIHNMDDNAITYSLCASTQMEVCWIGLKRINDTDMFEWSDDTAWNYGTDISGGVYPWGINNEPNNSDGREDCIEINHRIYPSDCKWNDRMCHLWRNYICNKPSELCYQQQWSIIQQKGEISYESCIMKIDGSAVALITNKKWSRKNIFDAGLKIEYTFKIEQSASTSDYGEVGIVIYGYNGNECNFISFGLVVQDSAITFKVTRLVEGAYENQIIDIIQQISMHYYELLIVCKQLNLVDVKCDISLDGIIISPNISIADSDQGFVNDDKYIGVLNENLKITAKALFVSGTPEFVHTPNIDQCTMPPTSNPTIEPTTFDPSADPTSEPTIPTMPSTMIPTIRPSAFPTPSPLNDFGVTDKPSVIKEDIESTAPSMDKTDSNMFSTTIIVSIILLLCFIVVLRIISRQQIRRHKTEGEKELKVAQLNIMSGSKTEADKIPHAENGDYSQEKEHVNNDSVSPPPIDSQCWVTPGEDTMVHIPTNSIGELSSQANQVINVITITPESVASAGTEVWEWLNNLQMSQYLNNFIENGYDSVAIIQSIETVGDLLDIGITEVQHQSILMTEIIRTKQDETKNECNLVTEQ